MAVVANIPSNAYNAINFLLFDLFFAAAVHYLTSNIAGLSNCSSVLNYSDEGLALRKSPFVGQGLTCINRRTFYSLAAIRLLFWFLIFGTSFFITGASVFDVEVIQANVTTIGKFGKNQLIPVLMERTMLREGCLGRKDNFSYFGEIRDSRNCELDLDLLVDPVMFGFKYESTNVGYHNCMKEYRNRTDFLCNQKGVVEVYCRTSSHHSSNAEICTTYGISPVQTCNKTSSSGKNATFDCPINNGIETLHCRDVYKWQRTNYRCKNAVVGCFLYKFKDGPKDICRGTVVMQHGTYLCRDVEIEKGSQLTDCKRAEGINWDNEEWLEYIGERSASTLDDAFAILYASGSEIRQVRKKKSEGRQVTHIRPLWFAILCTKIFVLSILAIIVLHLKARKGLEPLANDEPGITKLLQAENNLASGAEGEQEEEQQAVHVRWEAGAPQLRPNLEL